MTQKAKSLLDFAGIWENMPETEWREFEQGVQQARKGLNDSLKRRIERLYKTKE